MSFQRIMCKRRKMQLKLKIDSDNKGNAFCGVSILVMKVSDCRASHNRFDVCVYTCVCPRAYKDGVSKLRYAWFI